MTDNERDIKIAQTKQEVDDFKMVIESFIAEMRDRDNQRAAEIARVEAQTAAKIEALREKREDDMKALAEQREKDAAKNEATANELRKEIRDSVKHIQNTAIAAVIGIVAIGVGILRFAFSRDSEPQNQPPVQKQTIQTSSELAQD